MAASAGPKWELQVACVAALNASADIKSVLGDPPRIYEAVPATEVFPYVTLGEGQTLPNRAECIDGLEVYPAFHIWSIKKTAQECQAIAATMLAVLTAADLELPSYRVMDCYIDAQNDLRDPDGITRHTVLTLKILLDPI